VSKEIIVPDSIEPVVGFKALTVVKFDGKLHLTSPQTQMVWPKGTKAIAQHRGAGSTYEWVAVAHDAAPDEPEPREDPSAFIDEVQGRGPFRHITSASTQQSSMWPSPSEPPPDGHRWVLKIKPHQIAKGDCPCGIYVVQDMQNAIRYFHEETVMVTVALWGRVTVASGGARGQYAYPEQIVGYCTTRETAEKIAKEYEIELVPKDSHFARAFDEISRAGSGTRWITARSILGQEQMKAATEAVVQAGAAFPSDRKRDSSAKQDLAEVTVFATVMLLGMIGLGATIDSRAAGLWWIGCLIGWQGWLYRDWRKQRKRKEKK